MRGLGEVTQLLVTLMIGLGLLIGWSVFYGGMLSTYGTSYSDSNASLNTQNILQNVSSIGLNIENSTMSSQTTESAGGYLVIFSSAFESIKLLFGIPSILLSVVNDIGIYFSNELGINIIWFITLAIIIIGVYVAFILFKIILGREI